MTAGPAVPTEPLYFESPRAWRAWLAEHHTDAPEVVVGFHKRGTGRPTLTWPQSVEEALCFGWIDGVRRSAGPDAYTIRFTPRRPGSHWSRVNVQLVERLETEGRMTDAGRAAFAARREDRTARVAYEQADVAFEADQEATFRSDPEAWTWFCEQAAWYRKAATYWVTSAKRPETRLRRLDTLMTCSREQRRLPQHTR